MNLKTAVLIALMTFAVLVAGCAQPADQQQVKSPEQVTKTVSNVSQNIKDVQSTLEDIDRTIS